MAWIAVDDEKPQKGRWVAVDDPTMMDRAQAAASGVNSGVLTGLLGLPVDTAANLIDLAKAGYGTVKGVLGGKDLPEIADRADVVGSSTWIANQIRNAGGGRVIDAARLDDALSRYLRAAGGAIGGSMLGVRTPQGYNAASAARSQPNLITQVMKDVGMAGASGISGQGAIEATGNPVAAMAAGFLPQAATFGIAAGTRGAVRGGEASRQKMEDRVKTLTEAGVETPSVGLASGGRGAQALESLLSRIPGGAGVLAKNAEAVSGQLADKVGKLADLSAVNRGPETAGTTVRNAIADYRTRQKDIESRLLNRVEQVIPANALFPAQGMQQAGAMVTSPIPGAPAISKVRDSQRGFVNRMTDAVDADATPTPPQQVPTGILGPNGQPLMVTVPGRQGGLPFEALRNSKTLIGENAYPAANQLLVDQGAGAAKALYGGAKQDIREAARLVDQQRKNQGLIPVAGPRMDKANSFYAKTQKILEDVLEPIYKGSEGAPEKAFAAIDSGSRNAGSLTRQTMISLPAKARSEVAATVVDRLGKATPGQQNESGTAFSPATFLTNWNKITPEAKSSLFMGYKNASIVREGLDSVAAAASMIRDKAKVFPNASNTASATAQYTVAGSIGAGAISGQPALLMGALAVPATAFAGARLMTSPTFVTWLKKSTTVPQSRIMQHVNRLSINAVGEKDLETRLAMTSVAEQLREQFGDAEK